MKMARWISSRSSPVYSASAATPVYVYERQFFGPFLLNQVRVSPRGVALSVVGGTGFIYSEEVGGEGGYRPTWHVGAWWDYYW